jgi:polyisoprenoid-binding protein YceI
MKQIINKWLLIVLVAVAPFTLQAQSTFEIASHSMTVAGTSNLHDWTAEVEKVNGSFKVKMDNGKLVDIQALNVVADAQSFKSSKGSIMNSKINDALNSKKHPRITYKMTKVDKITETAGTFRVTTSGVMSIAGVNQNVTLEAVGKILPNGSIEFSGNKKVKMTDYKVEPPTAMFGAMTTGDEVTLTFKVILQTKQLTSNN